MIPDLFETPSAKIFVLTPHQSILHFIMNAGQIAK
jgi:hypothetical protein